MLAEALDIRRWLAEDRVTSPTERLDRDRAIGREIPAGAASARVLGWWRRIGPETGNRVNGSTA
jgi:hypothetical protein